MKPEVKALAMMAAILVTCGAVCACLVITAVATNRFIGRPDSLAPALTSSILPTYTVARSDPRISEGLPTTTGTRGAAGIGDPYYPEMGNAGYDVLHYDLDLKVDLAVEEISAVATIQARSLQILERFNLDLREFDSISVKVNGEDAAYTQAEAELTITPAAGIPDGSDFTVEVVYHGRPSEGTAFGNIDFLEGWNFYPGGVIVAGEPTGAETWFPSNNHPLDKATYAFHITVARPLIAAANGVLKERTDNGDGTWTYEWAMDDPMASYLATVAVSNFDLLEGKTGNGVPYRNYLDADIRKDVEDSVVVLPSAVDFFSSVFGPYPFDVCGLVVHQVEIPFSLETQTLIVMGHTFVNEIVVVHELAHQWFGDSVSVASWKDIWLNEGFASYAEGLWWEHTQGKGALQEDITRRYNFSSSLPDSETILIGDPGPERLIDRQVYNRGALTLHALRVKVGDDAFFRILRAYYDRFRDRNAATSDFIALAEELSGRDLRDFFQAWLYKSTLPDISELGFSR